MELFVGIIAAILLIMLFYLLYSALKDGFYLLMYSVGLQKFFISRAQLETINGYLQSIPYYMRLSDKGKKRFVNRLCTFMYNKEFKGAQGFVITEEMKVLISASAVQLTFGLEKYKLANLETIVIFPDIFTLGFKPGTAAKTEYKGATSPQGTMYLSWQSFKEGNANTTDKVNLGLHEMTHALKLSLSLGSGFDAYFANRIDMWESMAVGELEKLRSKAEEFLRPYGKTNMAEFFAVCAEAFFESPKEFSVQLPELYHYIVFLLNQEPNNVNDDYKIPPDYFTVNSFNIPVATDVVQNYKYNSWHWSLSLLLFGVLGGIASVGFLVHSLMVPYWFYIVAILSAGTMGLLQKRYFESHKILSGNFFVLYSYAGFGVSVVTLLLWINYLIPVTAMQQEQHKITSYNEDWISHYSKYSSHSYREFVGYDVNVEDDSWYNNTLLLILQPPPPLPAAVVFEYQRGLLGIKILRGEHYVKMK